MSLNNSTPFSDMVSQVLADRQNAMKQQVLQQLYPNGSLSGPYEQIIWPSGITGITGTGTLTLTGPMTYHGNRYMVVCNGQVTELPADATLEAAQEKAEQQAHQHQSEAFILKPVRKVAPKRDVVTTDL